MCAMWKWMIKTHFVLLDTNKSISVDVNFVFEKLISNTMYDYHTVLTAYCFYSSPDDPCFYLSTPFRVLNSFPLQCFCFSKYWIELKLLVLGPVWLTPSPPNFFGSVNLHLDISSPLTYWQITLLYICFVLPISYGILIHFKVVHTIYQSSFHFQQIYMVDILYYILF